MKKVIKKRNGDLSFHPFTGKVEGEKVEFKDSFVLAVGEHTNHKHVITSKEGTLEIYKTEMGLMLLVDGSAVVTHEEHTPIEFTSGTYLLQHEQEMDYFLGEIRRVQD